MKYNKKLYYTYKPIVSDSFISNTIKTNFDWRFFLDYIT